MSFTNDKVFLDTNIVVYAFDSADPVKQKRAWEILETAASAGSVTISTQVLQEFYVTVVRKLEHPLPPEVAERAVVRLARLNVRQIDTDTIVAAITVSRKHQLSFWDALIVQSALESRCARLLSEDYQDGLKIGDLIVNNPFIEL